MLQATAFQKTRLPLVAVAAFGLGLLTATAMPRLTVGAAAPSPVISASLPAAVLSSARAETGACGDGAYVTGDMVGDASPAAVYATLCGSR
jgi:hypothetical protein